jgi:hypothetical protein
MMLRWQVVAPLEAALEVAGSLGERLQLQAQPSWIRT